MAIQSSTTAPADATPESNSAPLLADLSRQAKRLHGQSIKAWVECAGVLLEARTVARHGEWLPFLKAAGINRWTAQRMLQIAQAGLKWCTVHHLGGIRATLDHMDEALVVQGMLAELEQIRDVRDNLEEREALMFESASPVTRDRLEKFDALTSQNRTLTVARDAAMREHAALMTEKRKLKHRMRSLDAALQREDVM